MLENPFASLFFADNGKLDKIEKFTKKKKLKTKIYGKQQ